MNFYKLGAYTFCMLVVCGLWIIEPLFWVSNTKSQFDMRELNFHSRTSETAVDRVMKYHKDQMVKL